MGYQSQVAPLTRDEERPEFYFQQENGKV
jgi:hypothetical protein